MAWPRRSRIVLAALSLLVGGTACSARRADRAPGSPGPVAREAGWANGRDRARLDGRRGYASFASNARLRDDTPMLTPLLEEARAADAPAPSYGPRGAVGEHAGGLTWADPYPLYPAGIGAGGGYGYPGLGYPGLGGDGSGAFVGPGGWVFPGLRPVPPLEVTSPFAAPFQAPAGSDVSRHRPGLSTGTGVHGRDADR